MKMDVIIAGGVLAIVGVAVVVGFFGDGYGRRTASPTASTASASPAAKSINGVMAVPVAIAPVIVSVAQTAGNADKADTPPNYLPANIQLYEAHWQGMDVLLLNRELRRKLKYPKGLLGILIGETTLNAAKDGFLAGDIIINVNDVRVVDLNEFQQSSRMVRGQKQTSITVLRKGERKDNGRFSMSRITLSLRGNPDLGFAQVEAAPMILPGAGRPHQYRGVCTSCHTVGIGFELTPDPGMITLPPPPIAHATVVKGISPHRDRGPCEACHVIKR